MKNFWSMFGKVLPILISTLTLFLAAYQLNQPCVGLTDETRCLYDFKIGLFQPLFFGGLSLLPLLLIMTFVPWRTYKAWLLTVLPLSALISFILISNISVYSSGVLTITRAQMAINCVVVLAILSALFVIISEWYHRRKNRSSI
jgi:hypothetical protein